MVTNNNDDEHDKSNDKECTKCNTKVNVHHLQDSVFQIRIKKQHRIHQKLKVRNQDLQTSHDLFSISQ